MSSTKPPKNNDRGSFGNSNITNSQVNNNGDGVVQVSIGKLVIPLIFVLALGGLAWALVFGQNNNGQNPQTGIESPSSASPSKNP
ncbi:hypothetical protein [Nostoc sp. GT001]|uniref:hypothetical protein n=1 Tax=Nostoc sp. GT001 TaxID=3056647 RepID=UPI0025AB505D|nr:hypothetical protein [Nostoc sp. GT001]MDM9581112.1 hypothetical protein [Nostoc sp. GT001]